MKILAFDMGRYTGYAITEDGALIDAGEVDLGDEESRRYARFWARLRKLRVAHQPDALAYEDVRFDNGNAGGRVIQGCRGIVEAEACAAGLLCIPVNVTTAKKHVIGKAGKGTKKEHMRVAVEARFNLSHVQSADPSKKTPENATDAVAVAITAESLVVGAGA